MNLHDVVRIKITGVLGTIVDIHGDTCAVEIGISCEIEDYSMAELEKVDA
jgi:hypothetical protein